VSLLRESEGECCMSEVPPVDYYVYIVRTSKDKLYTGITKDLERRVRQHNEGKGAKALRGQRPVELVWHSPLMSKSDALRVEHLIRVGGVENKRDLVEGKLVIYRTVCKTWSFALREVLEIITNGTS